MGTKLTSPPAVPLAVLVALLALATPSPAAAARVLGLAEALRTAQERQPTLAVARASTQAAAARSEQSRAGLLPQVSASAAYGRTTSNAAGLDGPGTGTSFATTGSWRFAATLSQLIWDFGQSPGRWKAAQASADAQRASEEAARHDALLAVQSAFFTARAGRDLLTVARDTLANQEQHVKQIEGFVRAGTRPAIDLAQARTDRANAAVTLVQAENAYLTEKAQLNQAMGVEEAIDYEVGDDALPPVQGEEQPLETLLAEAVRSRPALAALEAQARAQELTLSASRAGHWPSLGASTGLVESGYALDAMVLNWSAQLTLTWDLYQGGLTRAQVAEASANLQGARASLEAQRQLVRVELEETRLAVRAARESLSASGEALTSAREQLRLAEGRYAAGVGSAIELGDAQVALSSAAAQRVKAEYDLSSARAQLLKALGRTPEVG